MGVHLPSSDDNRVDAVARCDRGGQHYRRAGASRRKNGDDDVKLGVDGDRGVAGA